MLLTFISTASTVPDTTGDFQLTTKIIDPSNFLQLFLSPFFHAKQLADTCYKSKNTVEQKSITRLLASYGNAFLIAIQASTISVVLKQFFLRLHVQAWFG